MIVSFSGHGASATWDRTSILGEVDMAFRYSYAMCYGLAKECAYAAEFRQKNGSAYNAACRNGWIKDFTWFVDGRKLGLNGKWTDATCALEAQKYRRKVDFQKGASGAYKYAAAHGLLEKFDWFEHCEINLEFGRIYSVYRYVFVINGLGRHSYKKRRSTPRRRFLHQSAWGLTLRGG